jgi:hypothetical protein
MALYKNDIINIDLEKGTINRTFVNKAVGEGDKNGERYGVRVFRDGAPVSLNGCTVTGYFVRANGTSIILSGNKDGNLAYVTLTQGCYAVGGNFTLAIKITGGGVTGTVRIVDGTVVNTVEGTVVDPGGIVPDLEELTAVAWQAEDAAEAIAAFIVTEELISGTDYRLIVDVEEDE